MVSAWRSNRLGVGQAVCWDINGRSEEWIVGAKMLFELCYVVLFVGAFGGPAEVLEPIRSEAYPWPHVASQTHQYSNKQVYR